MEAEKTIDDHFREWERQVFGFGYGTGEPHVIPAVSRFFKAVPAEDCYDYRLLETGLGGPVAWLLINRFCAFGVDLIEYGTSPRGGWLTEQGRRLKEYLSSKTDEELLEIIAQDNERQCYPDICNCGPEGYSAVKLCHNPFWVERPRAVE